MKAILRAASLAILNWARCGQCEAPKQSTARRLLGQRDLPHLPFQSRIVGGTAADAGTFEYSVYIGGCGGSLIWEDIVLTAVGSKARPVAFIV
jgi:hypothetical protein